MELPPGTGEIAESAVIRRVADFMLESGETLLLSPAVQLGPQLDAIGPIFSFLGWVGF